MSQFPSKHLKPTRDVLGLIVFVALCGIVSGMGGLITAASIDSWHHALQKPDFNPPNWVFPPV